MNMVSKKVLSLFLCASMVVTSFVTAFGDASSSTDYDKHWAKEAIASAISSGISKGYPDGSFKPDNAITRAEFFALVNSTFKFTAAAEATYTDVAATAWYAPVIAKAKAADYISGYTDGSIHPESNITRQEAAMIISRLRSLTAVSSTLSFTDAPSIADWSKKAVMAVFEAKVMNGYPDGSFRPTAPIKRAEALVAVKNSFAYQTAAKPADAVKSTDTVYDKAGAYGSTTETVTVEGNVVIKAAGVTLQNTIIKGNLTIAKEVGNGEVTLKSVIVKGNTYVNGGGVNSIYFVNVTTGKVYVLKDDGPVRIVASGTSAIEKIMAGSDVKLEEVNMTGKGFEGITVEKNAAGGIDITLVGVMCESVDIQAAGVTLNADKASTIATFTADVKTAVTGAAVIAKAVINASGVTFQTAPTKTATAPGTTAPTVTPAPTTPTGGGGGGGGSAPVVLPSVTVGPQNGNLYHTTDGTATFTLTTTNIANGQPGVITYFDTNQSPVGGSFAAMGISCSNVMNNSASISVSGQHASPGTYYFKVTINGVTSSMISLVVIPATAEGYFTFSAGTITAYNRAGGLDVVIPARIGGVPVTDIGYLALSDSNQEGELTSVIIPDGLLHIGQSAFAYNAFSSINIPNSVTSIGQDAFVQSQMTNLTLGSGVITIGNYAFMRTELTSIILPNSVQSIGEQALMDANIQRITIGAGVTIGNDLLGQTADSNNNFRDVYTAPGGGAGTYVGTQMGTWAKVGAVSSITVSSAGNANAIDTDNGTLQMSATVLPANATDPAVVWSVANGTGTATISAGGLLTAVTNGDVTVTATSVSSPLITGTKVISLTGQVLDAITQLAIPGVVKPITGASPVTTAIDTDQYTGTVTWTHGSGAFAPVTAYTATVALTAKTGWTSTGVAANAFTVGGATTTNLVDGNSATAVFPKTTPVFTMIAVAGGGKPTPIGLGTDVSPAIANDYLMAETETTYEMWYAVRAWALSNGYTFQNAGRESYYEYTDIVIYPEPGAEPTAKKLFPVINISLRDAVVWLNALSEMEGKAPVYRMTNAVDGPIIKSSYTADADAAFTTVNTGYRLPTNNEWDFAARAVIEGVYTHYVPGSHASGATKPAIDANESETRAVAWYWKNMPIGQYNTDQTHQVKLLTGNIFNIYDMSGNVSEWCFDTNLHNMGARGGDYYGYAENVAVGYPAASGSNEGWNNSKSIGFRIVRTQ